MSVLHSEDSIAKDNIWLNFVHKKLTLLFFGEVQIEKSVWNLKECELLTLLSIMSKLTLRWADKSWRSTKNNN